MLLHLLLLTVATATSRAISPFVGEANAEVVAAPKVLAISARVQPRDFAAVAGVREFSARLIVRPYQPSAFLAAGLSLQEAWRRRAAARSALGHFELVHYVPQTDEYVIRLRVGGELQNAAELMATGNFQYAEPDWLLMPCACAPAAQGQSTSTGTRLPGNHYAFADAPNDPLYPNQWHHQPARMNSAAGWSIATGNSNVSIGVCDTGLRTTHEDLLLHRLKGYNAVDHLWESQGGDTSPVHNHGTRTTGTAAANGNNAVGVIGVGWNLGFRMLRVSNLSSGGAYLSDLLHAARTAIESGDRIANVSYSGVESVSNLTTASYIKSIGGLLVWAAGNSANTMSFADRDADDLIVVGATDETDALAYFSNRGSFVDLVAPGVNVYTTDSAADSAYAYASGTSFAAPLTSGMCALIWSARPGLSPNDVELILKSTCHDLGTAGVDDLFGYGRIDLRAALSWVGTALPQADFAGYPTSGVSPLTVQFTDLSTGVPTAWSWDFGDGTTSVQRNPQHVYTSAGSRSVTLTVTNALGADVATRASYVLVDVIPPVAAFSALTNSGIAPLSVAFADQSTGGTPTAWTWNFGDGSTSTQPNPMHVYTTSGYFTVSLNVSNAYGSDSLTQTNLVTVNYVPPIAAFSAQPTTGNSPFVVHFTDASVGGVATSWSWNFGDGATSTVQHPAHTYTVPGNYTVSLTATNAYGSNQSVRTNYISVGAGSSIYADFVGSPTNGPAPLQVNFTDLSVGNVVLWEWDFGDGTTSNLPNPSHVYTTPGDYDVSLQVTNALGSDNQMDRVLYVIVD